MNMDKRLFFLATQRNVSPIKKVLFKYLPKNGYVLEIGSGSGEHGVEFQKVFKGIIWQTSDPEPANRSSISSWIEHEGLSKKKHEDF